MLLSTVLWPCNQSSIMLSRTHQIVSISLLCLLVTITGAFPCLSHGTCWPCKARFILLTPSVSNYLPRCTPAVVAGMRWPASEVWTLQRRRWPLPADELKLPWVAMTSLTFARGWVKIRSCVCPCVLAWMNERTNERINELRQVCAWTCACVCMFM